MNKTIIAVDGPAGSGKSTIAKFLSQKFGIFYLDTGAMYRAVGYKMIREKINLDDSDSIKKLCDELSLDIKFENDLQRTLIDGEDVTDKIRTEEVSIKASQIATSKEIRLKLVDIQRQFAQNNGCVMDGRDIGSFVLPNADYKFYITASSHERATRRYNEYIQKGQEVDFDTLKSQIESRDQVDMTRKFVPLVKAEGAIEIDTTGIKIEMVMEKILSYIKEKH